MKLILLTLLMISHSVSAEEIEATVPTNEISTSQFKFTSDEQLIYDRGYISNDRLLAGGLLGTFVGFGIGHLAYGRYLSTGWIMTLGETASLALMINGATEFVDSCSGTSYIYCKRNNSSQLVVGLIAFLGFRIWELADVWLYPSSQNAKYEKLRRKMKKAGVKIDDDEEIEDASSRVMFSPYVATNISSGYGLQVGFQF